MNLLIYLIICISKYYYYLILISIKELFCIHSLSLCRWLSYIHHSQYPASYPDSVCASLCIQLEKDQEPMWPMQ